MMMNNGIHRIHGMVLLAVAALGTSLAAFAADPGITVSARQRYPWNGLVDINFTITGESGTKYDTSFAAKDMVGGTNIAMKTIRKSDGTTAAEKEKLLPGTYNWIWDAAADLPKDFNCERVTVTATADISAFPYTVKFNANGGTGSMANQSFTYGTEKALTANAFTRTGYTFQGWATSASGAKVYNDKQSVSNLTATAGAVVNLYAVWKARLYMVINLSSGASSTSYPISYLDAVPDGGWADIHKTTRLVLRRIDAGSFKMQGSKNVTLTKPFYIGIFEVTQRQYELVMGSKPSAQYGSGNVYPVYWLSYSMIRGSFLSNLRARTGLNLNLPTEAQWEYACRAGTTTTYYWGNSMNGNYAWYSSNAGGNTTHPVGTKKPNAWGVYDMSGNVWEWCLDWYGNLEYGTDPKGPSTGAYRICRGGCWFTDAAACTSSGRHWGEPTATSVATYGNSVGCRLCLTLTN